MALSPEVLKALAGASGKTSGVFNAEAANAAIGTNQKAGSWNLGQSIIDILSTGGYASAGITRKVGENVSAIQRGDLGGLLDLLNPLSVPGAAVKGVQERRTYSENLRDLGVDKNVSTWLGLALDIGLDPTTYITGGTIAGVKGAAAGARLASAANKANAVVVRSAAEAAAMNLPDVTRAFVPVVEPLTQGQKLGNYLTGVLRGYEFKRAERAADISNKKINKEARKYAKETGDVTYAIGEVKAGVNAGKAATNAIKGDAALINRDRFMEAVSKSTVLQQRYSKRFDKLKTQVETLKNTRFIDPKTAKKVDVTEASEAAKVAQLEDAAQITPPPVAAIEEISPAVPGGAIDVGNTTAAINSLKSEELLDAINADKKARAAVTRQASKIESSYSQIEKELIDYANKVVDPTTGKKLAESAGTKEELLDYIADGLRTNKLKPTANRFERFAKAIGTTNDPAQTVVELVNKTLIKMSKDFKKLADLEEEANSYARFLESKGVNATTENAAAAIGAVNAPEVGKIVEKTMDLEGEVDKQISDIIDEALNGTPTTSAKTTEELVDDATNLRLSSAEELIGYLDSIYRGGSETAGFRLEYVLRNALEYGPYAKLEALAKSQNKSVKDLIIDAASGNKSVINDPKFSISPEAVKLDFFSSEARFSGQNNIVNTERALVRKKNRTPEQAIAEESTLSGAQESLLRLIGVPVGTEENLLMQLRRDGVQKIGTKLSKNFVPQRLHLTLSDILQAAIRSGKGAAFAAVRYPGSKYQNIMPSNIEYAFLTLARYKSLGQEIKPGTEAWEAIKKSLNENYNLPDPTDGVIINKDVDDFFVPALHLDPQPITVDGKVINLKKIPDLDKKTDNIIQAMADTSDELLSIHATRAAAVMASEASEAMQKSRDFFLELFELLNARTKFLSDLPNLVNASPGNPTKLLASGVAAKGVSGLNKITGLMKSLMISSAKTAGTFKDARTADEVKELIINMFMKKLVDAEDKNLIAKVGDNAAAQVASFVTHQFDEVYKAAKKEIKMTNAMGATKRTVKVTPTQKAKGKEARRRSTAEEFQKASSLVPQTLKAQEPKLAEEIANPAPLSEEGSNISFNLASGDELEDILTVAIGEVTDNRLSSRYMTAMSGRFGIGLGGKTIIGGVEYKNITSSTHYFTLSLKRLAEKHGGDIAKIDDAFKLVQQWGKEMYQNFEAGRSEIPFLQWAQPAKVGNVNLEIADDLSFMVDALFGVDPSDVPMGVFSQSFKQPYFADELNRIFSVKGFFDIGDEQAFKLPTDIGPMGVKYSWARANVDTLKEGAKGKPFNSLTFLANYAQSLHAVQTRIGIGQSYSSAMGRTLKELKDEGLTAAEISKGFIKIDPEDEFGKFLDPEMLFDASELERMKYIKKYLTYERSFSNETVQEVVNMVDMITSILKASQTTWRMGHHVTTSVGEGLMNTLAGVTPKYYGLSFDILTKYDSTTYKPGDNPFKQYMDYASPKGMQLKYDEVGTISFVNSTTGSVTLAPLNAVMALADELGIIIRGGAGAVEDIDMRGVGALSGGLVGGVSKVNDKLSGISAARDNFFRLAHFIKEIEKGGVYGSLEEAAVAAAQVVTTYHPTVYGLSAFERKYMRRAVYFYTWQRIAATKIFQLIVQQPGTITIPSKIQYAFSEANGFNPESFGDPWDPNGIYASWNTGNLYGPQFQGPNGPGDAWGFGPAVPQLDILNSLFSGYTVQPGQTGLDAVTRGTQNLAGQNLSPLPKWFAELTTGNRVGTGGDIRNPLEYAIDQVGGINTISKITGLGQEPEKTLTPTEQAEKKTRLLINWLLGQKLQDYSTSQTQKQWSFDQTKALNNMLPNP